MLAGASSGGTGAPAVVNDRKAEPPAHHLDRIGARVAEERAPARLERRRPERAAACEEIEAPVALPRRGRHDPPQHTERLLGRIAGLLAAGRRDDRVPPDIGRKLPARCLLGRHEPRRHVRLAIDGLGVEPVGRGILHVDEDRVVLRGPAPLRAGTVVVGPDELVQEAFAPEDLVEEHLAVVRLARVEVEIERAVGAAASGEPRAGAAR